MNRCAWQDERVKQSNNKWAATTKEVKRNPQWKFVKLAVDVKNSLKKETRMNFTSDKWSLAESCSMTSSQKRE